MILPKQTPQLLFPTFQGWKSFTSIASYYTWLKQQGFKQDNIKEKYLFSEVNAYWANHKVLHFMLEQLSSFYRKNLYDKTKLPNVTLEEFEKQYADFYTPWSFEEFYLDPFTYLVETTKLIRDFHLEQEGKNSD
jgi:hypothetical protein